MLRNELSLSEHQKAHGYALTLHLPRSRSARNTSQLKYRLLHVKILKFNWQLIEQCEVD